MRFFKRTIVLVLAAVMTIPFLPACKKSTTVDDPKTINVQVYKAGFREDWIYELKDKFEAAFAADGYKVNIKAPSNDLEGGTVLQELALGYEETKIDLYVTGNIQARDVAISNEYTKGQALVEETEQLVYKQKAIGYDGKEEALTIEEKLKPELKDWLIDTESASSDKKYYGVPYINPTAGLVVNVKKLAMYGLEIPMTTDEAKDCYFQIFLGNDKMGSSKETGIYPTSYFKTKNGNGGYTSAWVQAIIAQLDYETYTEFTTFTKDNGNGGRDFMTSDAYKIFETDEVKYAMEFGYLLLDKALATGKSANQALNDSQGEIMKDKGAVFMPNGDWMLNEVYTEYKDSGKLHDIDFVNFPVSSELGVQLFGENSNHGLTRAEADDVLSFIVKLVDANKEVGEIVAEVNAKTELGVTITEEEALKIAEARGLYYNRGIEHQCFITKNSTKKDIAALFLRMLASEDCAQTIAKRANSTSAFATKVNEYSEYAFVKNASAITTNRYAKAYRWYPSGYRVSLNYGDPLPSGALGTSLYKDNVTLFDISTCTQLAGKTEQVYKDAAEVKLATEIVTLKKKMEDVNKKNNLN